MFPYPCLPVTLEFMSMSMLSQRSWAPHPSQLVKGSLNLPSRLELETASASAPVCLLRLCLRLCLCLRMRLRLHLGLHLRRLQSASATATAVPLSCSGGVPVCLSMGPPCPPRRCISVPSLRVAYSTD